MLPTEGFKYKPCRMCLQFSDSGFKYPAVSPWITFPYHYCLLGLHAQHCNSTVQHYEVLLEMYKKKNLSISKSVISGGIIWVVQNYFHVSYDCKYYFLLNYSPSSKNFIYICCSVVVHQIVSYVRSVEVVLMCTIDNHLFFFLRNGDFWELVLYYSK